ncbi:MAG TPA: SAV_2336 N-terminal domain-related protein, partial [Candidatus Competibacter sp.]|nr:SAV_2336 N-terminal domain-related protein [Candidatus Competibacter sp.]
ISSSEIEKEEQRPRRRPDGDTTPVYSVSLTGAASKPLAGRKIRVPGAAALPAALEIARALRPFSRRFPSRQRFVFDEEATVRHAADGGPLTPMLRPAMERWFEIALVVEETPAMAVWRQTITELQRLLAGQGAFRDVRLFQFRSTDTTIGIVSRSGIRRDVPQLIDSDGRRLILITSDCVSPGWRNGAMAKILAKWGARMPVVIVQMLPETLWRHTALGSASISLRAVLPGVPNKHLAVARPRWDQEPLDDSLPMPVVTLDPDSVSAWAGMVMGTGTSFPGVLLGSSASRELWEEASPSMEAKKLPDARERIQLFRDLASREAFQLAVYLAAVPLTLPVMRLVQRTMFRDYRQVHLAEVFLGGLLERLTPADVRCDPSEVEYDFYEGVREVLTKSIRRSEASKVLEAISKYVEDHTGKPFDFEALILDSGGEEQVPAFALPFARVGAEFIRRLGRPPRLVGREISVHRRSNQPTPFRDSFPDGTPGPAMVWLPGGPFTMGDDKSPRDNEKPAHPVTLSPFGIGQYPVTFEEYDRFCEAT